MITDYHDEDTLKVWMGEFSRRLPNQVQDVAWHRCISGVVSVKLVAMINGCTQHLNKPKGEMK